MQNKQILAVWGSPSSGKTLVSTKLACMLSKRRKDVVLVFCDSFVPSIPVILPNLETKGKSLGDVISAPEVSQQKIYLKCLTLKNNSYLTFLGYQRGENIFTYPSSTKSNALELLIQLRHISDYVILDCSSYISEDILSATALENADSVVRLGNCDLKGVSYFSSQLPCLSERRFNSDRHIRVLSNFKNNQPKNEIIECYGGVTYELPYVPELEEQYHTGQILEGFATREGKIYEKTLASIAREVFDE